MPSPRPLQTVVLLGLALVLASHAFIDLELAVDLPLPGGRTWAANAPVADLGALLLLPLVLAAMPGQRPLPPPPGAWGWALLVGAGLLSLPHAIDPPGGLHHLVRKPVLVYLVYGVGLAWAVTRLVSGRAVAGLVLLALAGTALLSLSTSVGRILAGDTLWYHSLSGLTPNHKTLAICLAGWLPLLLSWAQGGAGARGGLRRAAVAVTVLAGAAILASLSKTAWLGAGLGLGLYLPRLRPVAWRPRLLVPAIVLGLALAYYSPLLLRSRTMLDAARARHSLNVRAWQMFAAHPLVGSGSGMSTQVELVTFPHYRVNGVDAHGAIQKVASETGLVGLAGLGLFVFGAGRRLREEWLRQRAAQPETAAVLLPAYASLATFAVLHGQLLLSTELFSPTHWVPLATAWGLAGSGLDTRPGAET